MSNTNIDSNILFINKRSLNVEEVNHDESILHDQLEWDYLKKNHFLTQNEKNHERVKREQRNTVNIYVRTHAPFVTGHTRHATRLARFRLSFARARTYEIPVPSTSEAGGNQIQLPQNYYR